MNTKDLVLNMALWKGSGSSATLGTKTITDNGTYSASSDNLDGYSEVTVSIPSASGVSF